MRRNVMICTAATLTTIAALGGITAGSASAATGAPTTLTGSPNAATAVSASPPVYVATGTGPARACAIITAPALSHAKKAPEAGIAVPAHALSGATKPAVLAPAKAVALSRACPDGVCVTVVPAPALRQLKGVVHAPTGVASRVTAVHCAGAKGGAGTTEIKPVTSAITCPVPGVAAPAK
jgi:hypothetical protein